MGATRSMHKENKKCMPIFRGKLQIKGAPAVQLAERLTTGQTVKKYLFDSRQGQNIFSSPLRPDGLRCPPSLLLNRYWRFFPLA